MHLLQTEMQDIQALYRAETQRCADLREVLDAREMELADLVDPLKAELDEARCTLGAAEREEWAGTMAVEDRLGLEARVLDARDREIRFLERNVQGQMSKFQRQDAPIVSRRKQQLDEADMETSLLLKYVQQRCTQIACLDRDLEAVLEHIVNTNSRGAVGNARREGRELDPEDFLPGFVLEHLSLSEFGSAHVEGLTRKYRHILAEEESACDPVHHREAEPALEVRHCPETETQQSADEVGQRMEVHSDVVVSAPCEAPPADVDASLLVECSWQVDRLEGSSRLMDAAEVSTATFEQEAQLLHERLSWEMSQVRVALALDEECPAEVDRDLLRAIALGTTDDVKALLDFGVQVRNRECVMGWTEWHIAAAFGSSCVIECLQEYMVDPPQVTLGRCSHMGLPPLALACLLGRTGVVSSLLQCSAPVDGRDARGNTVLHWAIGSGRYGKEHILPMLLEANADPHAVNGSGQRVTAWRAPSHSFSPPASSRGTSPPSPRQRVWVSPRRKEHQNRYEVPQSRELPTETGLLTHDEIPENRCIQAVGTKQRASGVLSYTWNLLTVAARDKVDFARNEQAKSAARLSSDEASAGVFSTFLLHYTHAGLDRALNSNVPVDNPAHKEQNQQALVLTSERMLLFNSKWVLVLTMSLSQVSALVLPVHTTSVLVLRRHQLPDMVFDISSRSRVVEELQTLAYRHTLRWAGAAEAEPLDLITFSEGLVPLFDARLARAGTLAFVAHDTFVMLPFLPSSVLYVGVTFFFGYLDLHQTVETRLGLQWRWNRHFFMLKAGEHSQLLWCEHPNATGGDFVLMRDVRDVRLLDTPVGEPCLILDVFREDGPTALTLRADSDKARADWLESIQTVVTAL